MNGELMQYIQGERPVPRQDRQVARQAKGIYDRTRLNGLVISGGMALARHAMDETAATHSYARHLAGDDPFLAVALGEIEAEAINGARGVIRRYHGSWDL